MREVWHNTCLHLFHCLSQSLSLSLCSGCCVSLCVTIGWVELDLTSSRFVLVMNWVAAARVLVSGRLFFFRFRFSLSSHSARSLTARARGHVCVIVRSSRRITAVAARGHVLTFAFTGWSAAGYGVEVGLERVWRCGYGGDGRSVLFDSDQADGCFNVESALLLLIHSFCLLDRA